MSQCVVTYQWCTVLVRVYAPCFVVGRELHVVFCHVLVAPAATLSYDRCDNVTIPKVKAEVL